jgi:hypothetical protein
MKLVKLSRTKGFSLTELLIAIPIALLCGAIAVGGLWAGMTLMARNVSTNLAHLNTLNPFDRLRQDIHQSVTKPLLTGTLTTSGTFPLVSGTGPAAGLCLVVYGAGPYKLFNNTNANDTNIQVDLGSDSSSVVQAGMEMWIPSYNLDLKITSVTGGSNGSNGNGNGTNHVNCKISTAIGQSISTQTGTGGGSNGSADVPIYFVRQIHYYAANGQLLRKNETGANTVIVRNLNTPTPFTQPSSDTRFVGVLLGASNPDYSNRNYGSTDMLFTTIWIPYREGITSTSSSN